MKLASGHWLLVNQRIIATLGLADTIGIADVPEDTLGGLRWAAQHAIVAQRQKVRHGTNRVYVYSGSMPLTSLDLAQFQALAQRMHAVIKSGDLTATEVALAETQHALFQQTYLPLLQLRPILQCQVIFMAQAAVEVGVDAESAARKSEHFLAHIGTTFDDGGLSDMLSAAAR